MSPELPRRRQLPQPGRKTHPTMTDQNPTLELPKYMVEDGRIKRGNLVLLEAMGGGFTWGSALLRW